jgi:hypothetical protein
VISDCKVFTGDDAIVLKSWYTTKQACENVTITNCILSSSSTALKIGTESHGDFRNIIFSNCVITNSNRGLSIVVRDGGSVSDVLFSNIVIDCHRRHFNWWGNADPIFILLKNRSAGGKTGSIRNIVFENIVARGRGTSRVLSEEVASVEDIHLHQVQFYMSAEDYPDKRSDHCFAARNVKGLSLTDVTVAWDDADPEPGWGSALRIEDTEDLTIRNFRGRQGLIGSDHAVISLKNVSGYSIKDIMLDDGAGRKVKIDK